MVKKDDKIKLSIIIPVYQEADRVNDLINRLYQLECEGKLEIIVVDGDPLEKTRKAIKNKDVINMTSEKGRAAQMNAGAAVARGEVLVFLHADTTMPPKALKNIQRVLADDEYVGGAFELMIDSERIIYKLISKATSLRSRFTRTPYGDQAIFIKRKYFEHIGGYHEMPLMEDVELMQRIKNDKKAIYIVNQAVTTSPRKWEKEGIAARTLKNQMIKIGYMLGVSPEKLVGLYYSQKEKEV